MSDRPHILEPERFLAFPFEPQKKRRGTVRVRVLATAAVDTYVLDRNGLRDFKAGTGFSYFGGARRRKDFDEMVYVPPGEDWWVVVENRGANPVAFTLAVWE